MRFIAVSVLTIAFLASLAAGFYSGSNVIPLTSKNFDKEVLQSGELWIVEFYAEWCGHCKNFAPQYMKAASQLDGIIKVGGVDADKERELAGRFGIKGFPTVKIFAPDKDGKLKPTDYNGPREAKALKEQAIGMLKGSSQRIKSDGLSAFLEKPTPKAILFTEKKQTPPMWKGLSAQFSKGMAFGEVMSNEKSIAEQYDVTTFPSIIVITAESEVHRYEGDMKAPKIRDFFLRFAPLNSASASKSSSKKEEPKPALKSISPAELTEMLQKEPQKHSLVLVNSGLGGSVDEKAFEQSLKSLLGVVQVIRVKCDAKDAACGKLQEQYGLEKLPAVLLFDPRDGESIPKPTVYKGKLESKQLVEFATRDLPSNSEVLFSENMDLFLSSPVFPKLILFTKKDETPALYKALSRDFEGKILFGEFRNPDDAVKQRFNVPTLPFLTAVARAPAKDDDTGPSQEVLLQGYPGPLNYQAISQWLTMLLPKQERAEEHATATSSGEVVHITSQEDFDQHCGNKGGLCVVVFLDETASNHAQHLDMLSKLASKLANKPFHFVWMGTELASFAQPFDLPFGYPNLIALSTKRLRFATLIGAFSAENIDSFLHDVSAGRRSTSSIAEIPAVVPVEQEELPAETILDDDDEQEPAAKPRDEL